MSRTRKNPRKRFVFDDMFDLDDAARRRERLERARERLQIREGLELTDAEAAPADPESPGYDPLTLR